MRQYISLRSQRSFICISHIYIQVFIVVVSSEDLTEELRVTGCTKIGITLLAGESYTCTEWILSAPLTSSGLTPQFVHINYIPKCVWIALVHTQGLLFQRHANVFHSETPLSGPLLTARATVQEMIGTLQPSLRLHIYTLLMARTLNIHKSNKSYAKSDFI